MKKITNLRRKLLICEEKSRVKVQITNLRRKLLICEEVGSKSKKVRSRSKLLICKENQNSNFLRKLVIGIGSNFLRRIVILQFSIFYVK